MRKHLFIILAVMLLASPAHALDLFEHKQVAMNAAFGQMMAAGKTATSECTGKLYCENLETPTTGYDSTLGAMTATGNTNVVYTTGKLRGTQSAAIWNGGSLASPSLTASDTIYGHFLLQFRDDVTPTASNAFLNVRNSTTVIGKITLNTDGTLSCRQGTGTIVTGTTTLLTTQVYHVWYRYTKSTGSNGIFTVWLGTDTNKPETAECTCTNGNATSQADNIYFFYNNGAPTYMVIDQLLVKTTDFTTVNN